MIRYLQPAKFVSTTATHVVTSIILFDRHLTLWAWFRMTLVISVGSDITLFQLLCEIFTSHTTMPGNIMSETGFSAASFAGNYG
jgi:hypothetical protein